MTNDGSTHSPAPAAPTGDAEAGAAPPTEEVIKIGTGLASKILDVDSRTVERWIDLKKLRGGRPTDVVTGKPIKGSHRWVDARHVVEIAVGNNRADRVPEELRHLIPPVPPVAPQAETEVEPVPSGP